jgi:hypothetical protein
MAEVQTSYSESFAVGYAGMPANQEPQHPITRTCEDAAGIGFGIPVYRGTDDHGCTATPGGQFLGITQAHQALGLPSGATADKYPQYANVAIQTTGVIWVTAGEAVTDGAQAYGTSGFAIVDTSTSNTILPGWFFDTTDANAALVKLARR